MSTLALVLDVILSIFYFIVLARIVIGFIEFLFHDWTPKGFVAVLAEFIFSLTDPPLKLINRFVPPVRIGGVGLDLGPLILLLAIVFLRILVAAVL